MVRLVVKVPEAVLRRKAQAVSEVTPEILRLIEDMRETMYAEPGVGLAAPQVGESLQVIVWDSPENRDGCQALINPRILSAEGQVKGAEGCLSIPEVWGDVMRAQSVEVEGMRTDGSLARFTATDFTARILQHEIDHINGVLFIDRLSMSERSSVEKKLKKLRQNPKAL